MPFLTMYWKQIAITALALVFFSFGWYKGNEHQKVKFEAFLKEQEAFSMQQQAKNDLIAENQDALLLKSSQAYNETIKRIQAYYEKNRTNNNANNRTIGLRDKNAVGQSMPKIQIPAELFAEVGGNQDATLIERDCAVTTAQYNALYDAWDDLCKVSGCE